MISTVRSFADVFDFTVVPLKSCNIKDSAAQSTRHPQGTLQVSLFSIDSLCRSVLK
jgi:hypothetical protein